MPASLTLVSHALCPYVQRIAIALAEKDIPHNRVTVDLSNKPDWFLTISPLGRTPVLKVGEEALFESHAILEYLEETYPNPLHPDDAFERARHRAWIGFGSEMLNGIAAFYTAIDSAELETRAALLHARFRLLEGQLDEGPWFAGNRFTMVDAVFAPVFRYLDTFDQIEDFGLLVGLTGVANWRRALASRTSVRMAVSENYDSDLKAFLYNRNGALARMMTEIAA